MRFHTTAAAQDARTVVKERMERNKSVGLSIAFPVIGAGSGGSCESKALAVMTKALDGLQSDIAVKIVLYRP